MMSVLSAIPFSRSLDWTRIDTGASCVLEWTVETRPSVPESLDLAGASVQFGNRRNADSLPLKNGSSMGRGFAG